MHEDHDDATQFKMYDLRENYLCDFVSKKEKYVKLPL